MEFKQMLQKLKYCNGINRSTLTKEIIRHVNQTELLYILELLQVSSDMEYQVKLISTITAYLHYNNSCRDVIIKSTSLYDTISTIFARALPLKTTITLNFVTTLLYYEEDGGSRSRTLTLHAQNLIRYSGCLTEMTNLFTSYMLHTETWIALCRCLAEVCRGSELNQNFCSHLVPLCVQRCLQGSPDVLPVLQSLLFNHKRNINLFMQTDGSRIFNRKDYLRLEACLQLLNTVIQNADVEAISSMIKNTSVREDLQDLLKMKSGNIVKWTTIVLYYLDLKLKDNDKCYKAATFNLKPNILHTDSNFNDTRSLLQNIMTEILSYPSETPGITRLKPFGNEPKKLSNLWDISHGVGETKVHNNKSNALENKPVPTLSSKACRSDRLSFSFLMNESLKFNQTDLNNKSNRYLNSKINRTVLDHKKITQCRESREYSKLCDTLKTLDSKCEHMTDFKPTFVSTPKKLPSKMLSLSKNKLTKRSFIELNNKSRNRNRTIVMKAPKKTLQEKHNIKRSMSSRLLDAINESCTTVIRSVKNVFTGNKSVNTPRRDTADTNTIQNEDQKSYSSYSFTNYMREREVQLACNTNKDVGSETNAHITANTCNTCDDTCLLQQKFDSDELLKSTVKKLKMGINLYGCDFKRICKTMWPRETYMTPNVLYNLYRKLLVK